MQAERLATAGEVSYWLHGGEVYRLHEYETPRFDTYGLPMGARWECSKAHWDQWKDVILPKAT